MNILQVMNGWKCLYIYKIIFFTYDKECSIDTSYNTDKFWERYYKWKEPVTKTIFQSNKLFTLGNICCSVIKLYPTLGQAMDCSMWGFPVPHYFPEFARTHVHWVGDAIQLSHPLVTPSASALDFPSIKVFSTELALPIRWPNYWLSLISLQSKGFSRAFSRTTLKKHQFLGTQLSLWSNSYIHSWLLEKKHSFAYMDLYWQRCFSTF